MKVKLHLGALFFNHGYGRLRRLALVVGLHHLGNFLLNHTHVRENVVFANFPLNDGHVDFNCISKLFHLYNYIVQIQPKRCQFVCDFNCGLLSQLFLFLEFLNCFSTLPVVLLLTLAFVKLSLQVIYLSFSVFSLGLQLSNCDEKVKAVLLLLYKFLR